ncbi:MAG: Uma2 family endonuclease [Oscillatoriales cyanobacterium]|uniref:Uma2 family endonuclease n=1 Tax=Microcoleus anatoxicus PTRS2 TaxID=2705321 RepID=A0ABU8YM15_9CYAN|nr:MAG: Uma2 family endonuclease [Oscillatoriales cyanobacterium]TAE00736.1 MAG: Uma2 family endonuclease [Oscillatoriales cyanobacterium]TAE99457.1 MAG: Uma2 family endonuclease [Oscillatoriales cyanobacterium]TAF69890.1 MAG: Uma2 family endonuclease [Oscillatoriales cyanobacterium]
MISVAPIAPPLLLGEKRVVFRDISWEGYQQLLKIFGDRRAARLIFDRGTLEITMPLEQHEFSRCLIERLIIILAVELSWKIKTMGSTTLDRSDLERGAEPDNAYYIQNQPLVAGRTVDLATDPAPDLVVEVDITHTDINKLALYASMGVPEFWRYNGREWRIYQLENSEYLEVSVSPTFPILPKEKLYEFLAAAQLDEVEAEVNFRNWVKEMTKSNQLNNQ